MKKKYLVGVYLDLHFIAELQEDQTYKCIPKYSGGNGTDMNFFSSNPKAKFYDTIEEALGNKNKYQNHQDAIEEERQLTGYYNREY